MAEGVWSEFPGLELHTDYAKGLMTALAHVNVNVRQAAAEALAAAMYEFPVTVLVRSLSLSYSASSQLDFLLYCRLYVFAF